MRALVQELRAVCGAAGARPALVLPLWLAFMAVAAWAAHALPPRGVMLAALVFAIAALLACFVFGMGALRLLPAARGLCLPGRFSVLSYAGRSIGIFLIAGIAIPALLLSLKHGSADPAFLIASGALAGLLLPRMPNFGWAPVLLLVILQARDGHGVQRLLDWASNQTGLLAPHFQLGLVFALLAGLVTWRYRRILRGDLAALESAARGSRYGALSQAAAHTPGHRSDAWFQVTRLSPVASPVRVIRIVLGTPYAPTPWTARLRHLSTVVLPLVLVVGWMIWRFGWQVGWHALLIGWLAFVALASTLRMQVMRHVNGELAELALLPGFGGRRAQLRALCRASLTEPLLLVLAPTPFALAAAAGGDTPPGAMAPLLLLVGSSAFLLLSYIMATLARGAVRAYGASAAALAATLVVWWLAGGTIRGWLPYVPLAWAAIGGLLYIRRLARLPHPFVVS